jgi:hypothetical protein
MILIGFISWASKFGFKEMILEIFFPEIKKDKNNG